MAASFITWLGIVDPRKARQFLETHQELLAFGDTTPTEQHIFSLQESMDQTFLSGVKDLQYLREHLYLLRDIKKRGSTLQAIRAAYVNLYGGLVLDLPLWLEQQEKELRTKLSHKTTSERVSLLSSMLANVASPGYKWAKLVRIRDTLRWFAKRMRMCWECFI